jgi:hypothetical protein
MKTKLIITLIFCISVLLSQGKAEAVIGVPDVVQSATLIVPLMEKGISSGHNTLTVATTFCAGTTILHWQLWDIDGNAMTGLSGNVTITGDQSWVSDFGTILSGASTPQLTQLTDGSFYRGFMTIDKVTAVTSLLPTDPAYPFSPFNCLTGQTYYVRLLEGAANGIPMVHIEGGVNTGLSGGLGLATGFYQVGDDREEIDADGRYYAYTSSNGLPSAIDPNDKLDYILSRVYVQGNGESRIVIWAWSPSYSGVTAAPSDVAGPFPFIIRSEAGVVTTNNNITLPHVVNVIDVPGDTNGTAWVINMPPNFETYAFSFNSANFTGNAALTWEVMFESTIISEWLP